MSVDVLLMFAFFLGPFVIHSVHIKTGPGASPLARKQVLLRRPGFKNRGTIPTQGPVTEFMPRLGRPDKASQLNGYRQHVRVVPAEAIK